MDHNIREMNILGLSKSRYVAGLQCPKLLWLSVHEPEKLPPPRPFDEYQREQGTFAGKYAANFFPGAVRIPEFPIELAMRKTNAALESGERHIMEAAFSHQRIHVKVDVLRRLDNGSYDIIEVKSKTGVDKTHLDDLAIQRYVLENNGLEINATYIFHLNKEYLHPEGELFILSDRTDEALERLVDVPGNIQRMQEILARETAPEQEIGPHCNSPYDCPFKDQCWNHIPEISVFNIPRFRGKWDYYSQGIIDLDDVPADFIGTASQMPFIKSYRKKEPHIDMPGLKNFMAELEEPLYFMDFETMQLSIPKYAGTRPWQQLPVQWSVHKQVNEQLEHYEFIHKEKTDPRESFIKSLLDVLGESGSIIVWWAPFESGRLKEIADALPQHKDRIMAVIDRIWDQLQVFNKYYCDWRFCGSNSLKNVLPVIAPQLSYKGLEVQEGGTAMASYARMINLPDGPGKQEIMHNLLKYCELDTMAMVAIHKALRDILS